MDYDVYFCYICTSKYNCLGFCQQCSEALQTCIKADLYESAYHKHDQDNCTSKLKLYMLDIFFTVSSLFIFDIYQTGLRECGKMLYGKRILL